MTLYPASIAFALAGTALAGGCSQERDVPSQPTAHVETATAAPSRPNEAARTSLSCTWPIRDGDTAVTVMQRFGEAVQREDLAGPEGTTIPGLVLWGGDPKRRIELLLDEEAPADRIAGWRIAEGSTWSFAGLAIGDRLDRVAMINGAPFRFFGFVWDYGGYVTDWRGGSLDNVAGGCGVSVRLSPANETLPAAVMGEGELSSDEVAVAKVGARVSEISIGFAHDTPTTEE